MSDAGIASCFDAGDGTRHWMERLGGGHSASAITANGLAYFVSDRGITTVIRPGKEFEVVAEKKRPEGIDLQQPGYQSRTAVYPRPPAPVLHWRIGEVEEKTDSTRSEAERDLDSLFVEFHAHVPGTSGLISEKYNAENVMGTGKYILSLNRPQHGLIDQPLIHWA